MKPAPSTMGPFRFGASTGAAHADFDPALDPINSYSQGSAGGRWTVREGDTLAGIAAQLWGDASLWYKLAEANGMSGASAPVAGQSLTIPIGVSSHAHNASTFKPYDPTEAIGDTAPTNPKAPKRNNCGVLGAVMLVAIGVAVAVITSGAALALTGAVQGGLGAGISATLGLSGASAGALIGAGAAGGALGSIASQGLGVATGLQDKFSWKQVALAGMSGGVGAAVGSLLGPASTMWQAAARGTAQGLAGSMLTQSIGAIMGLQSKFDFAGVAVAGIGGGVSGAVGFPLRGINRHISGAISGTAGAIANAAARTLIHGTSFGDNILAALPDVIGATIGNMVADGMASLSEASGRTGGDAQQTDLGLSEIEPGRYALRLSDGKVLVGSPTEIEAGLAAHVSQLPGQGLAPAWVEETGASSGLEGGSFQEGRAILRYREGGTGVLWQDIHRNVVHGSDGTGVLGEWTGHFGGDRTAVQLVRELQGHNAYILSLAQYAAVGAITRLDHAGSLLSLSVELMSHYQPDIVITGSRPAAPPVGPTPSATREFLDSNYRVSHWDPPGEPGSRGRAIGLMAREFGESRRNGMSNMEALAAIGPAMAAAIARRRRGGGQIGDVAAHRDNQAAARNTGLDSHHVGQAAAMRRLVPEYDREYAPTILVPREGHTVRNANGDILSRRTDGINSARDLLARDVRELRRVYPELSNAQLQRLIEANKRTYPESFRRR